MCRSLLGGKGVKEASRIEEGFSAEGTASRRPRPVRNCTFLGTGSVRGSGEQAGGP